MDLDEFIAKTLVSIKTGVENANKVEGGGSYMIEPSAWFKDRSDGAVKFDIAVTASKEITKAGGAGIKVLSIGIGGQKEVAHADEVVSRIKFSVAINTAIS